MPRPVGMRFIRSRVRARMYRMTGHATAARLERGITVQHIEQTLLNGEIIEHYPDDTPYPCCLVLGWFGHGEPLHIVCFRGMREPALRIVTVYEPDEALWEPDYKTRKVGR